LGEGGKRGTHQRGGRQRRPLLFLRLFELQKEPNVPHRPRERKKGKGEYTRRGGGEETSAFFLLCNSDRSSQKKGVVRSPIEGGGEKKGEDGPFLFSGPKEKEKQRGGRKEESSERERKRGGNPSLSITAGPHVPGKKKKRYRSVFSILLREENLTKKKRKGDFSTFFDSKSPREERGEARKRLRSS